MPTGKFFSSEYHLNYQLTQQCLSVREAAGADPGDPLVFKLEIKKGNKTITEAILSRIFPISFCQVNLPS